MLQSKKCEGLEIKSDEKIVGELLKNKNAEKNLQEYYGRFMEINNQYAMIHLAMDYYTYYVSVSEDGE